MPLKILKERNTCWLGWSWKPELPSTMRLTGRSNALPEKTRLMSFPPARTALPWVKAPFEFPK